MCYKHIFAVRSKCVFRLEQENLHLAGKKEFSIKKNT